MKDTNPLLPAPYIFLVGNLSFGGAIGRMVFGLSLFDIALVIVVFLTLIKKQLRIHRVVLVPVILLFYGLIITMLHMFFDTGPGYRYIITESRFYVYQVAIFYLIFSNRIDHSKIGSLLTINIIIYILLYLLLREGNFLYAFFNKSLLEDTVKGIDFVDRMNGPPIIFITGMFFYYSMVNIKMDRLKAVLYVLLILIVYVKTGSRTGLILSLLPFFFFFLKKRNLALLILPALLVFLIPFLLTGIQASRFEQMLNPLQDTSFLYRILNISYMWNTLMEHTYALFTGYGIGSNYDIFLTGKDRYGYFLDNTLLTMVYKVGMILTMGYVLFIVKVFSKIEDPYLRYFVFAVLLIISVISYHFITNPGYLLTGLVLLNLSKQSKEKVL